MNLSAQELYNVFRDALYKARKKTAILDGTAGERRPSWLELDPDVQEAWKAVELATKRHRDQFIKDDMPGR